MKIVFVLPRPTKKIVGGFKVIYEYANFLVQKSVSVIIVHDCHEIGTRFGLRNHYIKKYFGRYLKSQERWISTDSRIDVKYIAAIDELKKIDADLFIATAINTVYTVYDSCVDKNTKMAYFIQDFENWGVSDREVTTTYRLPMYKITVSKWLYDLGVRSCGSEDNIYYCPNGIDTQLFRVSIPIADRNPHAVAFMYHEDKRKGMQTLFPALEKLNNEFADIKIRAFGAYKRPKDLPFNVEYTPFADQEQLCNIYNSSAIFVCSSHEEGYGLTGAESMVCGCALVTTDTNGSREYADSSNSIICKTKDSDALYQSVKLLLNDSELRKRIAYAGYSSISKQNLNDSKNKFLGIMKEIIDDYN